MIPRRFNDALKQRMLDRSDYRERCAKLGAYLNARGYRLVKRSRDCVRFMNHHVTNPESDWFVHDLPGLHARIDDVLERQRLEYPSYSYFYGHSYQALGILGVYGERGTEERFEAYGIRELVRQEDRLLDIGCNCGFMALYTAYRTGCRAEGIDINPYMVEIGTLCADYLRLGDRVELRAGRLQDDVASGYTVLFSFATHWTDDENYRVPLREHFERCAAYLDSGGLLVFESHAADVGRPDFYAGMDEIGDLFDVEERRDTDRGTRHLYLLRRRSRN